MEVQGSGLSVAKREKLSFGQGERSFKLTEQGGSGVHVSGTAKSFEFLGQLDDAFDAQVETHALKRVGMEGQHWPIVNRLRDLRNALRRRFEEKIHKFLQHADSVGWRQVAQISNGGLVDQVVGRVCFKTRQESSVGLSGCDGAPALQRGL